jgi:hypothetical protein
MLGALILILTLAGVLAGLGAWSYYRIQQNKIGAASGELRSDLLLLGLLAMAALTMGMFLSYVLLGLRW